MATVNIDIRLNIGGDYSDSGIAIEHGDIAILNGKFMLVPDDDLGRQVGQRLHIRLLLQKGEVFFNTQAGFPYLDLSKFKKASSIFDTYMKSYILATDGVSKLQSYSSLLSNSTRKNTVNFGVLLNDNTSLNSTQELDV